MRVTKRLANSAVRSSIGITTTEGRFSTGSIRTCKGLPSCSQKILVILHSPKLIEVQSQLNLTLLSGVFVCECEIGFSNWCIQIMTSAFPHSRSRAGYNEQLLRGLYEPWSVEETLRSLAELGGFLEIE